jgi:hypothetical protein
VCVIQANKGTGDAPLPLESIAVLLARWRDGETRAIAKELRTQQLVESVKNQQTSSDVTMQVVQAKLYKYYMDHAPQGEDGQPQTDISEVPEDVEDTQAYLAGKVIYSMLKGSVSDPGSVTASSTRPSISPVMLAGTQSIASITGSGSVPRPAAAAASSSAPPPKGGRRGRPSPSERKSCDKRGNDGDSPSAASAAAGQPKPRARQAPPPREYTEAEMQQNYGGLCACC